MRDKVFNMKNKSIIFVVAIFAMQLIAGCGGTPTPYSFAEKENRTASITFLAKKGVGVDLHYFENIELPIPKKNLFWGTGKYWSPVIFPAEKPFTLTINIYHDNYDKGVNTIFNCPALTADKSYTLGIEIKKEVKFLFIKISDREEKLVLKEAKTKTVVYELPL